MFHVKQCIICDSYSLIPYISAVKDNSVTNEEFNILRCKNCNLLVTSPQPTLEELPKYYSSDNYISHTDTREGIINKLYHFARFFNLNLKYKFIKDLGHSGKGTILDFGSGTGAFLRFMNMRGWYTVGVEPSASARKLYNNKCIYSSLDEIPDHDKFDIITLWHVLEHTSNPIKTLIDLSSKLNAHGKMIIAVPNSASFDFFHYKKNWAALDVPRHLFHFNESNLVQLAQKINLKLVKKKSLLLDSIYVSILSEKYLGNGFLKGIVKGAIFMLKEFQYPSRASSIIFVFEKMNLSAYSALDSEMNTSIGAGIKS